MLPNVEDLSWIYINTTRPYDHFTINRKYKKVNQVRKYFFQVRNSYACQGYKFSFEEEFISLKISL